MKTLILGPLDYPSARRDLILLNYNNNIYSVYYVLEGLMGHEFKKGLELENQTAVAMYLAANMTDKEYEGADIFFGLAPKNRHFDKVVCYNYEVLEAQEAEISDHYRPFENEFWTTADVTHVTTNIIEAIKDVEFEPTEGS